MRTLLALLLLAAVAAHAADTIKIAAAAGYKKPLLEVIRHYRKAHGHSVDAVFGNMKQVCTQSKHAEIALLIGDRGYLEHKSKLPTEGGFEPLGRGRLVVAFPQGGSLTSLEELSGDAVKTIAMPQPSKAIYGIAAEQFLQRSRLRKAVEPKLRIVATVPQVAAYLAANEVDAGLINLTAALASGAQFGGYLPVPQRLYDPIEIVALRLPACAESSECQPFIDFLHGEEAKAILKRYGL